MEVQEVYVLAVDQAGRPAEIRQRKDRHHHQQEKEDRDGKHSVGDAHQHCIEGAAEGADKTNCLTPNPYGLGVNR